MTVQTRRFELRADPEKRLLAGVAVRYGDVATLPWGKERIAPGAFAPFGDIILNDGHQRTVPLARTGGAGLELIDSAERLAFEATLPNTRAADDVLELVRARVMRGASVEFFPTEEKMVDGVVEIQRAKLVGIGVVDVPAYPDSEVAARCAHYAERWKSTKAPAPWPLAV